MSARWILFLLGAAIIFAEVRCGEWPPFEAYEALYHRRYDNAEDRAHREQTYEDNLRFIDSMNPKYGNTLGVNEFSDMSREEFRQQRLMPKRSASDQPRVLAGMGRRVSKTSGHVIPESYDWRDHGAVTPVKDQGTVGSCWAFSTTGALEGQWFLKTGNLLGFSEEQLVDCDMYDCGVFGGWPLLAYKYIKEAGGIQSEETFPYCCGTGKCYPCMANKNETFCGPAPEYCSRNCTADKSKFVGHLADYTVISKDESVMAEQLVSTGPLSVLLNADLLQFYHSGVWNPGKWRCDPTELDHAVLIVGYGVHKEAITHKEEPYWLVKNSWGQKWGEDGYFRIYRGDGKCGINTSVSVPVV